MKVYIGNYKSWYGCYHFAETLCFWVPKVKDEFGRKEYPEWVHDFGDWISKSEILCNFFEKLYNFRIRKGYQRTYIKIDKYDSWNAYCTIGKLIIPILKELKETTQSWPSCEEVPTFEDWEKILEKMIWSFEELVEDSWEFKYTLVEPEIDWEKHEDDEGKIYKPLRWKVEGEYDYEGMENHAKKIQEGLDLFAKFFRNLWD